ncbi:MAG: tRNA (adenosine(37)-N6)-dimethylallyltransferase, partial [Thermoprotei archaeon]
IKALIGGIAPIPDIPEEFRRLAKEIIREKGLSYCYELLIKSDPEYAIKISKTDSQRIERALEVLLFTKQGFSQFHKSHRFNQKRYEHISIRIIPDREILYKRIEKRTEDIFKNGIIEETKFLMENDYIDSHAFNAIGYYETYRYIKNEIELKDAIEMTARRTRQYAKRQMTWFRHSEGKIFNGIESIDEIFRYIEICLK